MDRSKNSIAINRLKSGSVRISMRARVSQRLGKAACKALSGLMMLCAATWAYAGPAGTIVNLSGPLAVKKTDGSIKALSQKSTVEEGDILITEKDTYARIRFTDHSEITLKPNTQFKIEHFSFEDDKPQDDNAAFSLMKGGLRAVTGALGKRNKQKVGFSTPTATIGIRGTIFIAQYVPPNEVTVPPPQASTGISSSLAPGLHVQVLDGMIVVTNGGGAQNFAAGQFGYTPQFNQPPVIVPNNPSLQFTPPPVFNVLAGPQTGSAPTGKTSEVDCEVR